MGRTLEIIEVARVFEDAKQNEVASVAEFTKETEVAADTAVPPVTPETSQIQPPQDLRYLQRVRYPRRLPKLGARQ